MHPADTHVRSISILNCQHNQAPTMFKLLRLVLPLGLIASFAAACGGVDGVSASGHIRAEYDNDGRLKQLFYDRNKNGRVDTVAFMDGARFVRIEIDSDEDGLVDRWEYYVGGVLRAVAFDTTGSGRPDRRLVYGANGTLERLELDPNDPASGAQ